MYTSKIKWLTSFSQVRTIYDQLTRKKGNEWCTEVDPDTAYEIYQRSLHPSLKIAVMGRTVVDRPELKITDFGSAIDIDMHHNFGVNSHNSELATANASISGPHIGSILGFYNATKSGMRSGQIRNGWHFAYNDSWILGGIHGKVEFHLASPRRKDNVINPIYGLTVTGRELVGLKTFGYIIRKNAYLGEVGYISNWEKAYKANYSDYITAIEYYTKNPRAAMADLVDPSA